MRCLEWNYAHKNGKVFAVAACSWLSVERGRCSRSWTCRYLGLETNEVNNFAWIPMQDSLLLGTVTHPNVFQCWRDWNCRWNEMSCTEAAGDLLESSFSLSVVNSAMGKEQRLFLGCQNELCDCWWRHLGVASWTARSGLPLERAHLYPSLRLVWGCPWDGQVCRGAVSIHQSIGSIRNKQWARVALYFGWFVGRESGWWQVYYLPRPTRRRRLTYPRQYRSDAKRPPLQQCASSAVRLFNSVSLGTEGVVLFGAVNFQKSHLKSNMQL